MANNSDLGVGHFTAALKTFTDDGRWYIFPTSLAKNFTHIVVHTTTDEYYTHSILYLQEDDMVWNIERDYT